MTDKEREERRVIGKRFAQVREDNHLNQRQLAEELGLAPSYISEIERGREPSKNILLAYKNFFKRDIEWFLTGIDSSNLAVGEKEQIICELENMIKAKDQEIVLLNQEKLALYTQLTAIQAELIKAKNELLKRTNI